MERVLSNSQMREADLYTIEKLGVCQDELVDRAGKALFDEINKRFFGGRVLVCVGKGNNGADGKILAKLLSNKHGYNVNIFNVDNGNFKIFENKFDIIVDCIFGTGLNKVVEGRYKKAVDFIKESNSYIISCDIPSGLNGDTGLVMGTCVKADLTIAIQEFKIGHFINDGLDYCGEIVAKDIGISIWGDDYAYRLTKDMVASRFANRNRNVNKGNFGKTCILGGSYNFPGSVLLSLNGLSALKMGIGYSNLAIPNCIYNAVAGNVPECTINPLNDIDGKINFDKDQILPLLKYDSLAVGMGMGVCESCYSLITYLLENYKGNLVIDADGLNNLSTYGVDVLSNSKCNVVLTPHIVEFARLIQKEKGEIMSNIIDYAKQFASKYNVVLILKSATTIITDGKNVCINTTGCSGMAKGGSGDVLSGIVAGLLCKSQNVYEDSCIAPYIFGLAGSIAQKEQNAYTVTPSDVINYLSKAINSVLH